MFSIFLSAALMAPAADAKNPFEFNDGDRVVLLGGTLIEREQKYGHWEAALTLLNKGKAVTFRNLGWSGDTVWCESRGSFDGPSKGYAKTLELVKELKPNVIVICYGQNESYAGEKGVKAFSDQLGKLIDDLAKNKSRIVLMSPTPFENVRPIADAEAKNANLKLYVAAMKDVAGAKKLEWFDLFNAIQSRTDKAGFTENGVHLGSEGYAKLAPLFGPKVESALLEKVVAKDELFFHRWRPQNETYLFGFRKHEQGKNGKEIAEFDPLVEAVEKEIAELLKKAK